MSDNRSKIAVKRLPRFTVIRLDNGELAYVNTRPWLGSRMEIVIIHARLGWKTAQIDKEQPVEVVIEPWFLVRYWIEQEEKSASKADKPVVLPKIPSEPALPEQVGELPLEGQ